MHGAWRRLQAHEEDMNKGGRMNARHGAYGMPDPCDEHGTVVEGGRGRQRPIHLLPPGFEDELPTDDGGQGKEELQRQWQEGNVRRTGWAPGMMPRRRRCPARQRTRLPSPRRRHPGPPSVLPRRHLDRPHPAPRTSPRLCATTPTRQRPRPPTTSPASLVCPPWSPERCRPQANLLGLLVAIDLAFFIF